MLGRTGGYEPWSYQVTQRLAEAGNAWTERFQDETATRIDLTFDAVTETEEMGHYWELARVILGQWARKPHYVRTAFASCYYRIFRRVALLIASLRTGF